MLKDLPNRGRGEYDFAQRESNPSRNSFELKAFDKGLSP